MWPLFSLNKKATIETMVAVISFSGEFGLRAAAFANWLVCHLSVELAVR